MKGNRLAETKVIDRVSVKRSFILFGLVIVLIISILGSSLYFMSLNSILMSERQRKVVQAFYNAEAGVERALFDLRQDFINDTNSGWADGDINGYSVGPDTEHFNTIAYESTTLNEGNFSVQLKNVQESNSEIWIKSTGLVGGVVQTIQVYAKIDNIGIWNNCIFAGTGCTGKVINGNVDICGSVHILGNSLTASDYAIELSGTSLVAGNNYDSLALGLLSRIPSLDTTIFNGESVETLGAKLRVKSGKVGLSGGGIAGQQDVSGNFFKETMDGAYITDGYGGNQATDNVFSDNGYSNIYDLGDSISFPSLSAPYGEYLTYIEYVKAYALALTDELSGIQPDSSFEYANEYGSISMDGNGNMNISGVIYIGAGNNLHMNIHRENKTINYTGKGTISVTGDVEIGLNLLTDDCPNNVIGIMTPNTITFNKAQTDVMGLFYAEDTVTVAKQTNVLGTIVSNYCDMGTNVPSIFQVPDTVNNLPPRLIGSTSVWMLKIVSWQRISGG